MTSQQINFMAPLASPPTPIAGGEVLTPSQWGTLMAIADTIIPSIEVSISPSLNTLGVQASDYNVAIEELRSNNSEVADEELLHRYLSENASSLPGLHDLLRRTIAENLRKDARQGISMILSTLDTRVGCFIATGSTTSFHLQPVHIRQQILHNWGTSYFSPLRQTHKALTSLFKALWVKQSPTLGPTIGFPRIPVHGKLNQDFDYHFIQLPPNISPEVIETDVIIVGSGCGGAVCAKNLAEAGYRVLVAEKAYHYPAKHLPMTEADAGINLYQNGGVFQSDENSIVVVAGQAWGGGGTVNWSASLQTQGFVRKEWSDDGLPYFTSPEFQNSLDRVCERMGVSVQHIEHNKANRILLEGSRKLGYSAKVVPQNTGGTTHYCGYCTTGCPSGEKQGPVVSFLPDAERSGAKFIEGFQAEEVMFEDITGERLATGVKGIWRSRDSHGGVSGHDRTSRRVVIKAKRVIVSAGTLQTPLLLMRSGLKNPQIGRNLHLHPVCHFGAIFPEAIRPWEGGILTSLVDEFQNLDLCGHGAKLEASTMLPSWFLPVKEWNGGLEYKLFCSKLRNMTGFISMARDKDTGRVYPDPVDGQCRISYPVSDFDRKHIVEGILALAKVCHVSGAREIFANIPQLSSFVREVSCEINVDQGINDKGFQLWLAEIRRRGLSSPDAMFASAHQMGTCRMGTSEKNSVVDPQGKVWGIERLYVADASVFPSASGVNPMVTNMAISDGISRGIAKGLRKMERVEERARL